MKASSGSGLWPTLISRLFMILLELRFALHCRSRYDNRHRAAEVTFRLLIRLYWGGSIGSMARREPNEEDADAPLFAHSRSGTHDPVRLGRGRGKAAGR